MGSTISILNDTESTWLCRFGPDEKALLTSAILGFVVAGTSSRSIVSGPKAILALPSAGVITGGGISLTILQIQNKINKNLTDEGFHEILSGATYESGMLTLSLWQQATCVSQEVLSPTVLKTKTLYMRPIFSGATHKSTNTYSIKEYLEGKGKVKEKVIKLEPNGASPSPTTA
jgi:hypothetical protein